MAVFVPTITIDPTHSIGWGGPFDLPPIGSLFPPSDPGVEPTDVGTNGGWSWADFFKWGSDEAKFWYWATQGPSSPVKQPQQGPGGSTQGRTQPAQIPWGLILVVALILIATFGLIFALKKG